MHLDAVQHAWSFAMASNSSSTPPYTEDTPEHHQLLGLLGLICVRWNMADEILKSLLEELLDGNKQIRIVSAHMNNLTLRDAVRTISPYRVSPDTDDAIQHYIEFVDIMREYRNYVVHGCLMFGRDDKDPGFIILQHSARKDFVQHSEVVTADYLRKMVARLDVLISYGSKLMQFMSPDMRSFLKKFGEVERPPLPDKPPLPDRLKKPRTNPLGTPHQRQASQN